MVMGEVTMIVMAGSRARIGGRDLASTRLPCRFPLPPGAQRSHDSGRGLHDSHRRGRRRRFSAGAAHGKSGSDDGFTRRISGPVSLQIGPRLFFRRLPTIRLVHADRNRPGPALSASANSSASALSFLPPFSTRSEERQHHADRHTPIHAGPPAPPPAATSRRRV